MKIFKDFFLNSLNSSLNQKFSLYAERDNSIKIFDGKSQGAILRDLQHSNVNISCTIGCYRIVMRPKTGRKIILTTPEIIQKLKARID